MSDYYYLDDNREPQGPYSLADLARLRDSGLISDATLAARRGDATWLPVAQLLAAAPAVSPASPPPLPSAGAAAPASVGPCPGCQVALSLEADGALPERCPACYRRLRVASSGIWANFCAAMGQYVAFSGRAARKEFWSFIVVSHSVMAVCFLLFFLPFAMLLQVAVDEVMSLGLDTIEQMPKEEIEAYMEESLKPMLEAQLSPGMLLAMGLGGVGLLFSSLLFFLPSLAVTVRRVHDVGWSGWWVAVPLLLSLLQPMVTGVMLAAGLPDVTPVVSSALFLVVLVLCFLDSKPGTNAYGPSPKYPKA